MILRLCDVLAQSSLQVHRAISLSALEARFIVIHIAFDEAIDKFGLTTHRSILNHRVENVLTLLLVVIAIWIQILNQRENVSHIDHIAVEQLQAEVYIANLIVNRQCRVIYGRTVAGWLFDYTNRYIEVLATEVQIFLLRHYEVWIF